MERDWTRARGISCCIALLLVGLSFGSGSILARSSWPATSVSIVNNSSREIRHLYLSPTNQDNWGPDQLEPATIGSGATFTLSNISCPAADIKVIAEDQEGCFLYKIVTCGENSTWTITNESSRDCGN